MADNKKPLVIYVEDQATTDHNEGTFNYYGHISRIIEECGFSVVHARDHNHLPQVLAAHPETVAIVSDVDTHAYDAGVEWYKTYSKQKNALPVMFATNLPTKERVKALMECGARAVVRKPYFETGDMNHPEQHEDAQVFHDDMTQSLRNLMRIVTAKKPAIEKRPLLPDDIQATQGSGSPVMG